MEPNAKTKLTLALCTVLILSVAARADDQDKDKGGTGSASTTEAGKAGQLSRTDEKFIKDACKGGKMEVRMGEIGVQKAQNDQVKQFAQKLIDDHTKANSELKQLASSKGLTLPDSDKIAGTGTGADQSDGTRVRENEGETKEHGEHAELQKLESLSGTEFDRQFVRMAVSDHMKDIREFEKSSQKAEDSEVRAFAQKTLPTLREHLQTARTLQSTVGGAGAPGSESATTEGNSTDDASKQK
jgi:putative membrane protein